MKNNKKKQIVTSKPTVEKSTVPKSILPAPEGYRIIIQGKPNSKESKIFQINDEYVGIAIAAPPKEGEANQELLRFLAQVLGMKKNTVYLDKGCKSRHKLAIVETKQITIEQIYQKLKWDNQN